MLTPLLISLTLAHPDVPPPHPGDLAEMLAGAWDNAAQIEAEGDPDRPHLHVRHEILSTAALEGVPLYAELRVGGPDGDVYRQRVYVISPAPGGRDMDMAVYELADPAAFAGADAAAFSDLTEADLIRFDPGCDFRWVQTGWGWGGEIEDGACVRTSRRSGREMIIGAEFTIRPDQFTHTETGRYADDGETVFGPPDGVPNIYDRVE
ncbi:MAG: chromophore lyase CpcT/CpeT [Alphaproteobacteria bacterium]|nr:chromophore lyase CpcT/CpeT [Alphaproteobacteria bacterium]